MGTDRVEVKRIPCPCGKGLITVTFCSPDHAYAHDRQTWREDKIECGVCDAKFTIVEQKKDLVLVSREDSKQTEAVQKQMQREMESLEKGLWEKLDKTGVLDAVVGYLNGFRSAAAAYRQLTDFHICRNIGDVQRKFPKQKCTKERVRQYIYPRALEKLLAHLQVSSASLEQYFKDDSLVRNRVVPNPAPIGDPILHLNR
jgi:hypothetical protein